MPFRRPAPIAYAESSGNSSCSGSGTEQADQPSKRFRPERSAKILPEVKLYIVQAKIDPASLAELFALAEANCSKLCTRAEDANVILTAITMRRRFERHISWEVAKTKAVVTPSWLRDSVAEGKALPCEGYVAFPDLRDETVKNCPTCDKQPCTCEDTSDERDGTVSPIQHYPSPPRSTSSLTGTVYRRGKAEMSSFPRDSENGSVSLPVPENLLPPSPAISTNTAKLSWKSRYACQRASPLICANQPLAKELDIIKRSRALEGEERSALSYSRAIAGIKAYPHHITSRAHINEIPYCGPKIRGLIEEYVDTDKISEAREIASSERFQSLSLFSSIYGIGPNTARRLYALSLRTIEDLEVYYGVEPEETKESQLVELEHKSGHGQQFDTSLGETWIKIALGLRKDLEQKIPRDEVEEMGRVIMRELDELEPGCISTIVGGYRRGKPESNDVDIVFTHPNPATVKGLCKRFVRRLHEKGMVTHVMHLSNFRGHNPLRTTHWDSLEKALTVFTLLPSSPFYKGTRRRLDLIFALPEVYWTAIIGWTGSIMFERDLRLWAKDKVVMKFDSSGITRRYDSKPFYPKTEKEVFDLLGLEWVGPTWRNADA
ncbi:Nucleotidyltransferase [Irpex rosettiformis]|uniref:Nucleotidyltransferase n=1 Tax=Irpex rosettiformis TaxID=378272 RepID=A0ACB8U8Z5_9APHY|nr:Nucleotidyltransferase [Irpex rosettiformis]